MHHQTDVPDGCRYFWSYFRFNNVKVWTKSFQMVLFRAPYDTNSILCLSAKFSDFWWKSRIFKNFQKSKNPRFSSKITELCGEPQDWICVVRSSKGHHSKGFCPYFYVYKLEITSEVSASIRHITLIVQNFNFNFFSPISEYSKTVRKYCRKTFPMIRKLFFSKSPEKVGFLQKKVR